MSADVCEEGAGEFIQPVQPRVARDAPHPDVADEARKFLKLPGA